MFDSEALSNDAEVVTLKVKHNYRHLLTYLVRTSEEAEENIAEIFDWLLDFTEVGAFRFRDRIEQEIGSLESNPYRCRVAEEDDLYEREVRLHLCRSGSSTYRILFTVYENDELSHDAPATVLILSVRHGASQPQW